METGINSLRSYIRLYFEIIPGTLELCFSLVLLIIYRTSLLFTMVSGFLPFRRNANFMPFQKYYAIRTVDEDKPLSDGNIPNCHQDNLHISLRRGWICAVIISMLLTTSLLGFLVINFYLFSPLPASQPNQTIQMAPCGNTYTQARSAGCVFDIISFSWLPLQCYDSDLANEFKALTDWTYWLDRNKTEPISQELALSGEFAGLYTEFEYHLRHCTYLWKKMHRAVLGEGKVAIDSVTGVYAHTKHCAHMLMTRREVNLDVVNAVIMVKYPDCGIA